MDTQEVIVPLLSGLLTDAESVIRQHLAAQLLTISIVCMLDPAHNQPPPSYTASHNKSSNSTTNHPEGLLQASEWRDHPEWPKVYDANGYALVAEILTGQVLRQLIRDVDVDVRRAAADALTGLALQLRLEDLGSVILPVPLQLAADHKATTTAASNPTTTAVKKSEAEQQAEEWRMTSANLLAELGGAVAEQAHLVAAAAHANNNATEPTEDHSATATTWGSTQLVPAILEFTADASFRVRRAAAQALPRILGAAPVDTVLQQLLPAFEQLSRDELYRVRKSTGECLVDMSRSLVILASTSSASSKKLLLEARRSILIPIADRLIQDEHKMVRQGMMQFLGPFMASFYPFFHSTLDTTLPAKSESDGSNHMGIVAQFFPHATSMVSRLNSSQNAVTTAPTPVLIDPVLYDGRVELERLQQSLPLFLQASRQSAHALRAVRLHRHEQAPPVKDLEAIVNGLLDYFAALAIVQTGDENTDAEMRVYCAYSFPAVVLLLGAENWMGALKTCFFTLLNPSYAEEDDDDDEEEVDEDGNPIENGGAVPKTRTAASDPPLPVKRCLASSLHTVAHILGPEIAVADILPVFTDYFLRDSDEAVRLNIIRGFPTFLGILPTTQHRTDLLLAWSRVMHGEDCLGAKKRSATNPLVLNWRQRDYLARSLPDLLPLLPPELIHAHIWPICQQLLFDSVSLIRDDVLWTIPMMFKVYTPDTIATKWTGGATAGGNAKKKSSLMSSSNFSSKTAVLEIVTWFKEQVLKLGAPTNNNGSNNNSSATNSSSAQALRKSVSSMSTGGSNVANFCDRQLFCRLCGTIGLSLRLNEEIRASGKKDLAAALGESFASLFFGNSTSPIEEPPLELPYQKLTSSEHKHLKKILEEHLLPLALVMKDDRIRNVRVTLLKVLQILPTDLRESSMVQAVLQPLHEEVLTWESFGGEDEPPLGPPPPPPVPPPRPSTAATATATQEVPPSQDSPKKSRRSKREKEGRSSSSGPVDMDDVEDEEDGNAGNDEDRGASNEELEARRRRSSSRKTRKKDEDEGDAPPDTEPSGAEGLGAFMSEADAAQSKDRRKQMKRTKSGRSHSSKGSKSSKSVSSLPSKKSSSKSSKKPTTQTVMEEGSAQAHELNDETGWKTVIFEDGPIGLQLEPTADDTACRVYGFLETGSARKSGKIQLGDVICKVNDVKVHSYDETVDLLKRGGRRAVTFRPGTATDSQPGGGSDGGEDIGMQDQGTGGEEGLGLSDSDDGAAAAATLATRKSKKKSSSATSSGTSSKKKASSSSSSAAAGTSSSSSKVVKAKKKKKSTD